MTEKLYQDKDWLYEQYWKYGKSQANIATIAGCTGSTIGYWLRKHKIPLRTPSEARARANRIKAKDPRWLKKVVEANRDPERRAKISEAAHLMWQDPEYRQRQKEISRRLAQDPEWLKKVSDGTRHALQNPQRRKKISDALRQRHEQDDKIYKDEAWLRELYLQQEQTLPTMADIAGCSISTISRQLAKYGIRKIDERDPEAAYLDQDWLYKMYWTDQKSLDQVARLAKCSIATIHYWMDKFNIPRRPLDWLLVKKCYLREMTSIEAICFTAFESLDLDFIFERSIYPYRVDFFFPSHGVIVEAMGKYWHNRPEQQEHDAKRKQYLEACGYTVLEWWGPDIKADVWRLIEEELLPLLDQPSRMERPPHGVSRPYRGPHGWQSAVQLSLFDKEPNS